MSYRHIAFIGQARSGKDTAGARLVQRWAFTRLAFADPLKHMALQVNPYVPTGYGVTVRLEALVADVGWERAKDTYPEVRPFLQRLGHSVREQDPDFWVRTLMTKVRSAGDWNMPVVVTDCRYGNEAEALRAAGFLLVRIQRPSLDSADPHASENELSNYPVDAALVNGGTVLDLHAQTDALVTRW